VGNRLHLKTATVVIIMYSRTVLVPLWLMYIINHKRKHLTSPYAHSPLILLKPDPLQDQIPQFSVVVYCMVGSVDIYPLAVLVRF